MSSTGAAAASETLNVVTHEEVTMSVRQVNHETWPIEVVFGDEVFGFTLDEAVDLARQLLQAHYGRTHD